MKERSLQSIHIIMQHSLGEYEFHDSAYITAHGLHGEVGALHVSKEVPGLDV